MDLWSRLIGGTGSSPTKHQPTNSPAGRLEVFKRSASALQHIWRTSTPLSASNEGILTYCRNCLHRLNGLLDEESTKPAPYLCLLEAASSQIYIIVTKLALSSEDALIIHASARFFNILINGEADGILDSKIFARSVVDLARRRTGNKEIALDERQEGDLVELLFAVTTKLRLDPDMLPAWFYPAHSQEASGRTSTKGSGCAGASRRIDFPLFYLLIDHVYRDGRTGDFARTGLLYLTDTAARSKELEKWMIESDLAMLMASGLGALYSRLSPRLPSTLAGEQPPPVLALSDWNRDPDDALCAVEDFRHNIDAFLQYLLFWQDTLDHCQSVEVRDTLLDHFQVLFLQQVLYPSLLESSDANGGSTAAVITYLCQILESLDNPDLVRCILQYLLASKPEATTPTRARKQRMSLSRRRSFDALTALAMAKDDPSPDLFNIVDLLVMSLESTHAPTVVASLKLIAVAQQRHHRIASASLIHTSTVDPPSITRELSELNAQLRRLMGLAAVICDGALADQSYRETLKDALELLDSHCCSWGFSQEGPANGIGEKCMSLMEDDPILAQLNGLLACFFSNDTTTNLALTEAIIALASCPLTGLNGWLLPHPQPGGRSTFMSNLEGLTDQVRHFRMQIPEWAALIAMQKLKLDDDQTVDDAAELASASAPSSRSVDSTRPSSLLASERQSIEVPRQSGSPLRRAPPRTLHSEVFGSLDESLSSSPVPPPSSLQQATSLLPGREKVYLTPPSGSPSSRAASRSNSTAPDHHSLRTRFAISPLPDDPSLPRSDPEPASGTGELSPILDHPSTSVSTSASNTNITTITTTSTTASLSHVLVNAVILHEFILEVAAVVQTRACLFGEVRL